MDPYLQQRRWQIFSYYVALVGLSAMALAPIWVMIATSFKDDVLVQSKEPLWFFFVPTLDNYEYIMTRGRFDRYLWNSVIVGTLSTVITLFLGGLCAYAIARTEFRGPAACGQYHPARSHGAARGPCRAGLRPGGHAQSRQ